MLLLLQAGCAGSSQEDWVEGGVYSTPNEDGTYSVLKILKLDEGGVHVRLYSNVYPHHPTELDLSELYMAGMDRGPKERLGMGHVPFSRESFAAWGASHILTASVTEEELEGYYIWEEAEAGYFE